MENADEEIDAAFVTHLSLPSDIPKKDFNSNDPIKADYFFHECLEWQDRNHIHRAHFLVDRNKKKIIAYITLHLMRDRIKIDEETIYCPMLWVSNFAIDIAYKENDLEPILLAFIHKIGKSIQQNVGCRLIMIEVQKDLNKNYKDPKFIEILKENGFNPPFELPFEMKKARLFLKKVWLERWVFDLKEGGGWS
jgi:hypothetical protein